MKMDNEIFTTDRDWKEVFSPSQEDDVKKLAKQVDGELCFVYLFDETIPFPDSIMGRFIGFLIRKDGILYDALEIEEVI